MRNQNPPPLGLRYKNFDPPHGVVPFPLSQLFSAYHKQSIQVERETSKSIRRKKQYRGFFWTGAVHKYRDSRARGGGGGGGGGGGVKRQVTK